MTLTQIETTKRYWPRLASTLHVPRTETEYEQLVGLLDKLVDEVGEEEDRPLASLMELLGVLIERYEDEHVPELRMAK